MPRVQLTALAITLTAACASSQAERTGTSTTAADCGSADDTAKGNVPSRCETTQAMQALQSDIARCSQKEGAVHVTVVFDSYGLAKDVQVNGKGYDADALLCVKGNGLRAKVRPFTAEKFVVEWDYDTGRAAE